MRKMASIQRIAEIKPINGADKIVKARVGGWWVVTAIDNGFKEGDLVIYCEIDSWIPTEIAPFLSKGQEPREYNGVKGERLRTVKLRGQLSQGLILPLTVLECECYGFEPIVHEGDDVSEVLGIQKFDPPVPASLAGISKGAWPSAIPKTDQERVQNLSAELEEWADYEFEVTEKLDGSSCTMALVDGEFVVCSRNINLVESADNTFWKMARKYDVENKLREKLIHEPLAKVVAIQGEVIGEGIQGNYYGIKGQDFYVFDVFVLSEEGTGTYASSDSRLNICLSLELKHVPLIGVYKLSTLTAGLGFTPVEALLNYAEGKASLNESKLREGVVFKRLGGGEHFKAVSNKFLEKTGG